jgi:YMGG-like Gly-zipper
MTTVKSLAAVFPIVSLAVGAAYATPPPIVYPAKGQTAEQQQKDSTECAAWAKQSTGIDPAAVEAAPAQPATTAPAPSTEPKGERVRGAARGAVVGAAVGEVANDDADEGAKVGAIAGTVAGGRQSRKNAAQAEQQAAQADQQAKADAEAAKQEKLSTYNRANAACMEGRGYTIK